VPRTHLLPGEDARGAGSSQEGQLDCKDTGSYVLHTSLGMVRYQRTEPRRPEQEAAVAVVAPAAGHCVFGVRDPRNTAPMPLSALLTPLTPAAVHTTSLHRFLRGGRPVKLSSSQQALMRVPALSELTARVPNRPRHRSSHTWVWFYLPHFLSGLLVQKPENLRAVSRKGRNPGRGEGCEGRGLPGGPGRAREPGEVGRGSLHPGGVTAPCQRLQTSQRFADDLTNLV